MSREVPIPLDPNFQIAHPLFEGPLDLLLHLIQKHELNILDLPIAFVTEAYLSYIELMKQLNLDVASEYLVMAAELARIKSKMLLPKSPYDEEEGEEEEMGDPREELILRLLEYQKYKKVAEELDSRGMTGRDFFTRGVEIEKPDGPAPLAEMNVFKLIDAFQGVLKRVSKDLAFEISAERITIQERMTEITDRLASSPKCQFEELFETQKTKYDIVVTFLAILEMGKMRMLRVYQADPHSPLYVEYRVTGVSEEEAFSEMSSEENKGEE